MSAVVNQEKFLVRNMDFDDLNRVIAIEKNSYHYPWSEKIFRDCLTSKYSCMKGTTFSLTFFFLPLRYLRKVFLFGSKEQ